MKINDYLFEPCGYSMNGILRNESNDYGLVRMNINKVHLYFGRAKPIHNRAEYKLFSKRAKIGSTMFRARMKPARATRKQNERIKLKTKPWATLTPTKFFLVIPLFGG